MQKGSKLLEILKLLSSQKMSISKASYEICGKKRRHGDNKSSENKVFSIEQQEVLFSK